MKSFIPLLSEKLNCSFVFIFNLKKSDSNYMKFEKVSSEDKIINESEFLLNRSLKHLELVNYLESCQLDQGSKYFPNNFINEMTKSKYDAKVNAIRASLQVISDAA